MVKKGLTLLEVLVSVIVMALLATGLFEVLISAKKLTIHARSRVAAVQMSKNLLDYLQVHVRADTWNTSASALNTTDTTVLRYCDSDGSHTQQTGCLPEADRTLDTIIYNANYTIIPEFNLRRVTLRVTWNETTLY